MCGIVGLFAKSKAIEAGLGAHLSNMLIEMTERGPDSAGVAVYRRPASPGGVKLTVLAPAASYAWDELKKALIEQVSQQVEMEIHGNHAVLILHADAAGIYDWFCRAFS